MMLCSLIKKYWHFGGTCCPYLHGRRGSHKGEWGLLFNPEDRSSKLLLNVSTFLLQVWFYSFWSVTLVDTIKIISITPPSVIKMYLYAYMPLHVSFDNNHHQKAKQHRKSHICIQVQFDHTWRSNWNYFNSTFLSDYMVSHPRRQ
jgi:hypothetical protein